MRALALLRVTAASLALAVPVLAIGQETPGLNDPKSPVGPKRPADIGGGRPSRPEPAKPNPKKPEGEKPAATTPDAGTPVAPAPARGTPAGSAPVGGVGVTVTNPVVPVGGGSGAGVSVGIDGTTTTIVDRDPASLIVLDTAPDAGTLLIDAMRTGLRVRTRLDHDPFPGTIFRHDGRIWIVFPIEAFDGSWSGSLVMVDIVTTDGRILRLGEIPTGDFRIHPNVPDLAIAEVGPLSPILLDPTVAIPPLSSPDNPEALVDRKLTPNASPLAAGSPVPDTKAIAVVDLGAEPDSLVLAPPLPASLAHAPLVDEGLGLAGIAKPPFAPGGPVERATSSSTLAAILASDLTLGMIPPFGWRNPEGLARLLEYLAENGLDLPIRWQIVTLADGRFEGTLQPALAPPGARRAIAAVSEAKSDDLNMRLFDTVPPARDTADQGPELDAAIRILSSEPCKVLLWEPGGTSDARVLMLEFGAAADGDAAGGGDLPMVDGAAPETAVDGGAGTAPGSGDGGDAQGAIVTIPLRGTVGFDASGPRFFTAADFRAALAEARKLRPSRIVLDIESGGGRVDTKEEILRAILSASAEGERFVALVRDAGSAAALISLACQEILVYPEARIGSAVTVAVSGDTTVSMKRLLKEDPELAAKYASFDDAIDRECALAAGRSPAISDAMKDRSRELWWSTGAGFSAERSDPASEQLDDAEEVLTLTRSVIVRTGLGKQILSTEEPWQVLGFAQRPRSVDLGREMMRTPAEVLRIFDAIEGSGGMATPQQVARLNELFAQP